MTDKTIVSFLLDETGSMDSVRDKTVSGFNEYVATLRTNETPTLLRLMTFNTEGFSVVYNCEDIHSVADLTRQSYRPRALTNLCWIPSFQITAPGSGKTYKPRIGA